MKTNPADDAHTPAIKSNIQNEMMLKGILAPRRDGGTQARL
jgi:hypothetical protein